MERQTGTKKPLAFRVRPATLEHLKRRAYEVGQSQTSLAERYVEEGIRMDEHPLIYFRGVDAGRRPALLGTRLDVAEVIKTFRQNGSSSAQTAEYLETPPEHVEACLRYYAAFGDELDEWISRTQAVAEREEALWRRRQDLSR